LRVLEDNCGAAEGVKEIPETQFLSPYMIVSHDPLSGTAWQLVSNRNGASIYKWLGGDKRIPSGTSTALFKGNL
jgi:hypothetical protein